MLRVLKLHDKVASSQLPALQIAPRTKVALESCQFSASSSQIAPRTKVVLQCRQFSASSSPDAVPATKSAHGDLPMEVHKVLHLPRHLHMEVHKVLHLPRNLHMEVHKVLHLPRNLHMEVHKSVAPATKSAHAGSQSAVPATKSALQETTIPENDPSMTRDRLAPVVPQTLTCQLRSHRFH